MPERLKITLMMNEDACVEIEFELEFDAHKAVPSGRHYPGDPAYFEPTDMKCFGYSISDAFFNTICENFETEMDSAMEEHMVGKEADYADHLYDRMRDEGLSSHGARGLMRRYKL